MSTNPLTGFTSNLDKAAPRLRFSVSELPQDFGVGQTQTQVLMMECMQPFQDPPELKVAFSSGGASMAYTVPLPILLTHFCEGVHLDIADFDVRWGRLVGAGLEGSATFTSPLRSAIRCPRLIFLFLPCPPLTDSFLTTVVSVILRAAWRKWAASCNSSSWEFQVPPTRGSPS